jgi:hypothetical protein
MLLLASSCKLSRWKRASALFFHFAASLASSAILTFFAELLPKLTLFGPLADVVEGMASLAEASATLPAFGADVEGAVGWIGASDVGGIMAGDDLAFKGTFWPGTFFCLYRNVRLER